MNCAKNAADKFEREWLLAKPEAVKNYAAVSADLATASIRRIRALLQFWQEAITSGKWANRLSKYEGNDLMATAYRQKLESITFITDASKQKVANTVEKKQTLMSRVNDVLEAYRTSSFFYIRFPSNVTETGLRNMVGLAIMNQLKVLEQTYSDIAIAFFIQETLINHFGWPFNPTSRPQNSNTRSVRGIEAAYHRASTGGKVRR